MTTLTFLNAFDRSGSSAILNCLRVLPNFQVLMQPFNSSGVRRKMYTIWNEDTPDPEDKKCFRDLSSFRMPSEYFVSVWHRDFSSTKEFVPQHHHVLKTTINHFLIPWTMQNFPSIKQYAIWRDPLDILGSVIRNNAFKLWYQDALREITATVRKNNFLSEEFASFIPELTSDQRISAFLIAVRNSFMFHHIDSKNVINYELFRSDPTAGLRDFVADISGTTFDFSQIAKSDLNLWGAAYVTNKCYRDLICKESRNFADRVFAVLYRYRPPGR